MSSLFGYADAVNMTSVAPHVERVFGVPGRLTETLQIVQVANSLGYDDPAVFAISSAVLLHQSTQLPAGCQSSGIRSQRRSN